uniref:Uncharacterized protein n=1 Tax=Cucumis melo TaxID=3656 RepID=A0A9I9EKW6_CUCME
MNKTASPSLLLSITPPLQPIVTRQLRSSCQLLIKFTFHLIKHNIGRPGSGKTTRAEIQINWTERNSKFRYFS